MRSSKQGSSKKMATKKDPELDLVWSKIKALEERVKALEWLAQGDGK